MNFCTFPRIRVYGDGLEVMAGCVVTACISIAVIFQNCETDTLLFIDQIFRRGKCYFLIKEVLICEFSGFLSYSLFCRNKIEKSFTCRIRFIIPRKHKFHFVLFYQKIINTITTEFSPVLLFRIEYF